MAVVQFYSPGEGVLVALPNCLVFLPNGAGPTQIGRIWEGLLGAEQSLLGSLEVLTRVVDPSLETLPPFVIVQFESQVHRDGAAYQEMRIACRGDVQVEVRSLDSQEQTLTGSDSTMWRESLISRATMLTVGAPARSSIPLLVGCVQTGGFHWSADALGKVTAVFEPDHEIDHPDRAEPDLGATLTEVPEEWLDSSTQGPETEPKVEPISVEAPQSTAPLLSPTGTLPGAPPVQDQSAVPSHQVGAVAQRVRSEPVAQEPEPYFGSVHFAHGQTVNIGAPIVVGRNPSIAGSGAQPNSVLVTVPSPSKDISRNHLGVHVDQGYVIATDLDSVNGTILRRAGQPERLMNPREGTLILTGDVLDLGDGAILTFQGIG